MPWEQRGKNRYSFRRQYKDGKEIRVYFGRGPEAERAAAEDAAYEAIRKLEFAKRREHEKGQKFSRTMIQGAVIVHRAFYGGQEIYRDRDGSINRTRCAPKNGSQIPTIH